MKWIKIIILCCIVFIISCRKMEVIPQPEPTNKDIFSNTQSVVTNGQEIEFKLEVIGRYTLVLFDSTTQQVVSKERFNGILGNNIKKIYTKSLSQKNLYLYLTDENNNKIKKTTITIN